jgi:hypothetical protein
METLRGAPLCGVLPTSEIRAPSLACRVSSRAGTRGCVFLCPSCFCHPPSLLCAMGIKIVNAMLVSKLAAGYQPKTGAASLPQLKGREERKIEQRHEDGGSTHEPECHEETVLLGRGVLRQGQEDCAGAQHAPKTRTKDATTKHVHDPTKREKYARTVRTPNPCRGGRSGGRRGP